MAKEQDFNLDPISKEVGAHPVGTGLGAAAGGAASGAVAGAFAGPVGAVVGGVAGAIAGGLGGRAVAEKLNPTAEEAYWRDNYTREPYVESGRSFDDYAPAYRMGVEGVNRGEGRFADRESQLAAEWDSRRESSTLEWRQARLATQAAWDRGMTRSPGGVGSDSDSSYRGEPDPLDLDRNREDMSNDDVVDTLDDLLECSRDGEYGYRECAERAEAADVKAVMLRHAESCQSGAAELERKIVELGGDVDSGGTVAGAMHRGWVSVRGALTGHSDQAMLDECERGEDAALARYRKALKQSLPAPVRSLVERQMQGVQRNHDQIKALRDTVRAANQKR